MYSIGKVEERPLKRKLGSFLRSYFFKIIPTIQNTKRTGVGAQASGHSASNAIVILLTETFKAFVASLVWCPSQAKKKPLSRKMIQKKKLPE